MTTEHGVGSTEQFRSVEAGRPAHGGVRIEKAKHGQNGGALSRPLLADDGRHLTPVHRDVRAANGVNGAVTDGEPHVEITKDQQRLGPSCTFLNRIDGTLNRIRLGSQTIDEMTAPTRWQQVLNAVIDALFAFYRTDPGFRVLWFSRFQSAQMIQANVTHDLADARLALGRLEQAGLHLTHPNPEVAMHLTIGIIDKGLDLAFRLDRAGDVAVVEETKVAVCAHLERYVVESPKTATVIAPNTSRARRRR